MFIMDVPPVPVQDTPVVLAQADTSGTGTQLDFILKDCQETFHTPDPRSAFRAVDPGTMLAAYIGNYVEKRWVEPSAVKNITLLQGTQHGNLLTSTSNYGRTTYRYDPEPGFYGNDQAIFMAEYGGKRYKIVIQIKVTENYNENDPQCPDNLPVLINASKPSSGASGYGSSYDLGSVSIAFADLAAGALGQTNANGITLDDSAAGHNWFIDPHQPFVLSPLKYRRAKHAPPQRTWASRRTTQRYQQAGRGSGPILRRTQAASPGHRLERPSPQPVRGRCQEKTERKISHPQAKFRTGLAQRFPQHQPAPQPGRIHRDKRDDAEDGRTHAVRRTPPARLGRAGRNQADE